MIKYTLSNECLHNVLKRWLLNLITWERIGIDVPERTATLAKNQMNNIEVSEASMSKCFYMKLH